MAPPYERYRLVSQPEIAKKSIKPHILAFKVIGFGANRKPVYDFLLVINSNLALSCTIIEIQRLIGQKSQIFPTPSHLAPLFEVTLFKCMEKLYGS